MQLSQEQSDYGSVDKNRIDLVVYCEQKEEFPGRLDNGVYMVAFQHLLQMKNWMCIQFKGINRQYEKELNNEYVILIYDTIDLRVGK